MDLLIDKTIRDFSDLLSSNQPAPGGGSTAALAGVMAASLTMMVANLSFGKKPYEELGVEVKNKFKEDFETISGLKNTLMDFVDKDTEAFNLYMDAIKMPKETDEDKAKRNECMISAGLYALEIPLKVAESCLMILRKQSVIAEHGNKNAISDIGVGALFACTGLEGAVLNVKINLPGIKDETVKKEALKTISSYLEEASELKSSIMEIVYRRL